MKAYTMVAVAMAASLMGCATALTAEQQARLDAAEHVLDADRMVQGRIAESTGSIASTLQLIERIERGERGPANAPQAGAAASASAGATGAEPRAAVGASGAPVPKGGANGALDARMRIQWRNGSAEELLRALSKQMGIPFKVTGERRPLPPISVSAENESMGWILAYVGKKVDNTADVVWNNTQQPAVLELRFK